jgi:hypothetical protein
MKTKIKKENKKEHENKNESENKSENENQNYCIKTNFTKLIKIIL